MYTADPSAHVWADGRLYVYASHDIAPPRGCDLMDRYHVFSTDDMVHWTDHGEILNSSQVPWGRKEGGFMWAPDCAYKNGTYYFYFPHPSETNWDNSWKIGVATSCRPAEGFEVKGYIEGMDPLIDPCVFVDDNGQAYIYNGGGGICKGGKLKDNMMELDGLMQPMEGLEDFHEATWVHKYNGKYYMLSSGCTGWDPNIAEIAVADSIMGTWKTIGNPCTGPDADKTFYAQSTYVQPVVGKKNAYIAMFDRWKKKDLEDSRYVWLPVLVKDGKITIPWHEKWNLSIFDK